MTARGVSTNVVKDKRMKKIAAYFAVTLASVILAFGTQAKELVNTAGASGIAVGGFDTVAFFTDKKPVNGDPGISSVYQSATYIFASKEHKDLFDASPEKYLPQCGGFCAFGVSVNALFPVDIVNTWQVRDGKLYFNLNKSILKSFNKDFEGNVAKADKNWPELVQKHGK